MIKPLRQMALVLLGALAILCAWRFRTETIQDVALWGLVLFAVGTARRRFFAAWLNPAGILALAFVVLAVILLPLGVDPKTSFDVLEDRADLIAVGLALPVLLSSRNRVMLLLFCCALAITSIVWWDLVRLVALYGREIMQQARYDPNPILIHPNISAMAAGIAVLLGAATILWHRRSWPFVVAGCVVVAVNILYVLIVRSRSPQLALMVALSLSVFLSLRSKRARLAAVVCTVLAATALIAVNPRFRLSGVVERDLVWRHTATLVAEHPVVGYGFGEEVFRNTYHASDPPPSPHKFWHPHMYWLHSLFCFGIPASLIQAAMWMAVVGRLIRRMPGALGPEGAIDCVVAFALIAFIQVLGLADCTPNIIGLAALWALPLALAATQERKAVPYA